MPSLIGKAIRTVRNDTPVSYTPSGRSRGFTLPFMTRGDKTSQMEAYGQVSTLFSIVDRISNAVSQVEWHLWREATGRRSTATGGEVDRTEVTSHAALDLWNNPNPFMDQNQFVETVEQHYELTGEGWMVLGRDPRSKLPLTMWPVRPDRMAPVPHPTKFIAGYVYTSPDGEQVPLGVDDVIYLRRPSPLDPYRGMGPVQAAMVDLESAKAAAEWNRNFFRNSAEPGGIIEVEKRLTDPEFDEMTQRWREQHQGVSNAHRVAVLEQGKWIERKYTQKDMQFAELRGVSREVIREAFGIHSHMLGISEDVNKANAYAGEASFGRWIVFNRAQRWKNALNNRLLPMFGATDVKFDHDRVVPEDREADDRERTSKAQAAQLLRIAGWEPDDILQTVGLPPMRYAEQEADNNLGNGAQGDGGGDGATTDAEAARALAEIVQKIYLGVDKVVTWDEAREVLRAAGAELGDEPQPRPPGAPAED